MAAFGVFDDHRPAFWGNMPSITNSFGFTSRTLPTDAITRTQTPSTSGTSVLGIAFKDGVMIAADTLGSYGSLAKYRQISRLMKVNELTILGAGGDYADYQFLKDVVEEKVINDECMDDGFSIKPKEIYSWLTRVLYNRRSKFDPLWNQFVIGGIQDGKPFLGHVDKLGTAFEAPHIATGYGTHLALPMLRQQYEKNPNMNEAEALELLQRCMRVLYYRDARSLNKYEIGIVTKEGSKIQGPFEISSDWSICEIKFG